MEIILRQAVENLGTTGDVVKVKSGYARNYLLPHGLAYEATPGNLKRIQQERERLEAAENERRGAGSAGASGAGAFWVRFQAWKSPSKRVAAMGSSSAQLRMRVS